MKARVLVLAAVLFAQAALAQAPMVLRRGNQSEPDSLDPAIASTAPENNIVGDLFMGLTTEDAASHVIPGMAERWTASPDGLTWTFTLRPNLQWSDGVALTANDFVFGFRRLMDPKTAARYASVEYVIKNAEAVNTGKLPPDRLGVRAIDDRTLEIALEAPTPYLPALMKHYTAFPVPEHVVRKYGDAWVKPGTMVSNGAYVLSVWKPHDRITLVKNPRFFDAATVRIDEVTFYPIENEDAALTRFRAREIDANIGPRAFPIFQYDWLRQNMPGEAIIEPNLANDYIVFNTRRAPFDDGRLRRAVSLCIDRGLLSDKVAKDKRLPAYAFVPPGISNYPNTARLDFAGWSMDRRREEAERLLAEAGYGPKHPLTFEFLYINSVDQRRWSVAQAAMLKQCGIVARSLANELKIHYNMIQEGDFAAAWAGWIADYSDPQNFLYLLDSRSGVFNYGAYTNPTFDALMDEAKVTLDLGKRGDILARAEQIALDDNAIAPLDFSTAKELVAPYVKGFVGNAEDIHRTRWMWIDRRD